MLLTFLAEPVFPGDARVSDHEVSSGQPFIPWHSTYFKLDSVYDRIAQTVAETRRSTQSADSVRAPGTDVRVRGPARDALRFAANGSPAPPGYRPFAARSSSGSVHIELEFGGTTTPEPGPHDPM
ncbi:hypothetical protein BSZ07_05605 [Streptomyces sp. M1013]|uniref:hypothetical protein n=1 Tax=Streptomyces sp. M1013 TaxID=549798 RepID=UPI000978DA5F|nr:hypothetical protein [Streptomyces sp. M1013]OMI90873.1 hypothetical protein BSZ07_05605 [Streptomyces sp. M1013]